MVRPIPHRTRNVLAGGKELCRTESAGCWFLGSSSNSNRILPPPCLYAMVFFCPQEDMRAGFQRHRTDVPATRSQSAPSFPGKHSERAALQAQQGAGAHGKALRLAIASTEPRE